MTFPIRRRWAFAIAVLVGATLLGAGCGGDDGSERAVEWAAERAIGPKSLRLVATVEICVNPVQLEQPIIEYEDDHAYIELRHTPEEGEGEHSGCFLRLWTLHKTVTLERDLDELTLFDASTDPPEQRWPRPPLPGE
ncbi:MAG TPA: hypothetical protein VFY04_01655 [Solirubrobacterales bacterium]|nr:hypothetical protein [Solirubrobacterales bacterium]